MAGFEGGVPFNAHTLRTLYKASHGVPRLINILCHKSLMVAYGRGMQTVAGNDMKLAIKDTAAAQLVPSMRPRYATLVAAALVGIGVMWYLVSWHVI